MVAEPGQPQVRHITYKCELTLMASQWNLLALEAELRNISGRELIQAILSKHAHKLRNRDLEPLPEAPPEDA